MEVNDLIQLVLDKLGEELRQDAANGFATSRGTLVLFEIARDTLIARWDKLNMICPLCNGFGNCPGPGDVYSMRCRTCGAGADYYSGRCRERCKKCKGTGKVADE